MKKKLLKPPPGDGDIFFHPPLGEFLSRITDEHAVTVAHQPYFFNPGVSAKFIFLQEIPRGRKRLVFVDTDAARLVARVPSRGRWPRTVEMVCSEQVLRDLPTPEREVFRRFREAVEEGLAATFPGDSYGCLSHFRVFMGILERNSRRRLFKQTLAESFLDYYGIGGGYRFLSDLLNGDDYKEFVDRVCGRGALFRDVFNRALEDYRTEFRFRFRNFPFPPLAEEELPFWVIEEGRRRRCYARDWKRAGGLDIVPRAVTLMLFLRLYRTDFFIHGIGGWNYEWVGDRIIERFFEAEPPPYAVASGTFLIDGFTEREYPYFFFSPRRVRERVQEFIRKTIGVRH